MFSQIYLSFNDDTIIPYLFVWKLFVLFVRLIKCYMTQFVYFQVSLAAIYLGLFPFLTRVKCLLIYVAFAKPSIDFPRYYTHNIETYGINFHFNCTVLLYFYIYL